MAEDFPQNTCVYSTFLSLPVDAISEVCLHLSPNDAIILSSTCSFLHLLIKTFQNVWKVYCKRMWLHTGPCCSDSWYLEFLCYMSEWSECKDCYADVKKGWDSIYQKLRLSNKNPDLLFRPAASDSLLSVTEKKLNCKLPVSYRCFLRFHNGQVETENYSLFGTELHFYHITDEGCFLLPAEDLGSHKEGLLQFTSSGKLQSYLICVTESSHSKPGEVKCNSKIKRGVRTSVKLHTLSSNFKEWFCRLADEFCSYPIVNGAIMRFPYSSECVATTRGICIQVGTSFSNVYSIHITDSLVIYHITISMSESESSSLTSQLLTRHWAISDENGAMDPVDGPGVVGHTPIISPGTVFTYTSGSHVEREWSLMEGYFTFENQKTGEKFDAKVPPFYLVVPPHTWIVIN